MDPTRERFINQLIADINTDGFEALVENGTVTRDEANAVYRRLGNHLKAYDLLPRRSLTIPQEIRARLWDTWMKKKKVPMPEVNGGKKKRSFT